MLLQGGTLRGERILEPETVALMARNQIGALPAGVLKTNNPPLTNDVDFFPGQREVTCYSCHRGALDPIGTPTVESELTSNVRPADSGAPKLPSNLPSA